MHLRMQRLHAAVEHFGEAGVIADFRHRQTGFDQRPGGAARGQNFDVQRNQSARGFTVELAEVLVERFFDAPADFVAAVDTYRFSHAARASPPLDAADRAAPNAARASITKAWAPAYSSRSPYSASRLKYRCTT